MPFGLYFLQPTQVESTKPRIKSGRVNAPTMICGLNRYFEVPDGPEFGYKIDPKKLCGGKSISVVNSSLAA